MIPAERWMELGEVFQRVMDVVIGHRNQAVHGGFDPEIADGMAAELHSVLLERLFETSE